MRDERGDTALHRATWCSQPDMEIIRLLLQYGADKNIKDRVGRLPLDGVAGF